ncbi:MAG: ribosome small subunit-dependent GTPase A [Pirellulales bacterium]|nr:ribosome small subunit-dependent GTPase A [Pirellulales bacterium]
MAKKKRRKIRTDFRKNREVRTREKGWAKKFDADAVDDDRTQDAATSESVSGKGAISRRRTVIGVEADEADGGFQVYLDIDEDKCLAGRVLNVHGLHSTVQLENGELYECATRRLLKSLATDARHVVVTGDRVMIRPVDGKSREGIIERVEPRSGVVARESRGRQHIIVANVDQLLIVASAAEPGIKPHLIDRYLITAEKSGLIPIICINKADLVDLGTFQQLAGVYRQMGYRVVFTSAATGFGIPVLRRVMAGRETAVSGQSGVGKSSLLNTIDPELQLRTSTVSAETQKGRHTTTTAELLPLSGGGYVVDTPGIRQFALWDVIPSEVAGYFRDIRPYVSRCRFPDCTHTHEVDCAVKDAVADDLLDARRYDSYCHIVEEGK